MTLATVILGLILAVALALAFTLIGMPDRRAPDAGDVVRAYRRLTGWRMRSAVADIAELQALWSDFTIVWHACRMLAAASDDPDFVSNLFRSYAAFHLRYAQVRLDIAFGLPTLGSHADQLAHAAAGLAQSGQPYFGSHDAF